MTRTMVFVLILALSPTVFAHNNTSCEWRLAGDVTQMQIEIWRHEAMGRGHEAAEARLTLDTWLGNVPIDSLSPMSDGHNSLPQRAALAGGSYGVFKRLRDELGSHNPRHEVAAVITNEELSYPVRIPALVWRRHPEFGSLQLWVEGSVAAGIVDDADIRLFDFLIDNYDRIPSNRLMHPQLGSIAIDHAGAFSDIIVDDWTIYGSLVFNCSDQGQRLSCVSEQLKAIMPFAKVPWRERLNSVNLERLVQRLELWISPEALATFKYRLCILKALFEEKNPGECGTTPGRA